MVSGVDKEEVKIGEGREDKDKGTLRTRCSTSWEKKWEFVAKALLSDFEMLGDVGDGAVLRDGRAQGVAWPETRGRVNSLDIENSC